MPNMLVLRPADAVETAECWELALRQEDGPSVLALTRQELPTLRDRHTDENLCARGAYLLTAAEEPRDVTILATGSEVHLAVAARERLAAEGIAAAVASVPSFELFERQDPAYRAAVLGSVPRVAVEAASPFGWTRYVASEADVVGMTSFGASGPFKVLYEHFGLTPEHVAAKARALLGR
jgi:transketolase